MTRERVVQASLLGVAFIHLIPATGALGGERLASLYGMPFEGAELTILMRHRAVLFGILGGLLVAAAFRTALRPTALVAGFVSVVSFLGLALGEGGYNPALGRVVTADVVALALLAVAFALSRRGRP